VIESLTLSLCEGCHPAFPEDESFGDVFATLGRGQFDREFARRDEVNVGEWPR
jgi:hypothetical protein